MAIYNVFLLAFFLCAYLSVTNGLTCNVCTGTNGACSGTTTTCTASKCVTASVSGGGAYTSACDVTGLMPIGCNTVMGVTTCVTGDSIAPNPATQTCRVCTGTNGACSGTTTTCTATKCVTVSMSGGGYTSACDMTGLMPIGCNTVLGVTTCVTGITTTTANPNPGVGGSGTQGSGSDKQSFCILVLLASLTIGMIL